MTDTGYAVELRSVIKRYGDFEAVKDMDLPIPNGTFVTLLGPSGCGKTTTLRMIAGLETPTEGDIFIKGRRVNNIPIHQRNLGLVFQNYALFPHKTVFDNVAFGLKYRRVDNATMRKRVREALELVRLPQMGDRLPSQLSGGQQQRIALARAIVIRPDVLLLDEPLSALDANLREEMRVELKRIQRELGITTIFVTHDQAEALAMSDKVVVMNAGWKEQEGSPEEVYNRPVSRFVAEFLGHSNLLEGTVHERRSGGLGVALDDGFEISVADGESRSTDERVRVVVRAEKVFLSDRHEPAEGATLLDGTVTAVDYQGLSARYFVSVGDHQLQAINSIDRRPFREGERVHVRIRASDCVVLEEPQH
ncbi:MAG: ABC transporter ATP-binding protein [Gammaproteobacteria bacterium]|nr:ABC transporter ATP-binding protein [Gammaproteobacteria bacterium]NIR84598.1 ABC transporter ATP-binding protein [Gammaproteobacteria bacterium]NIR90501.1 ABC transporter ATP-binding protein [Gammaproteobacteria bacterium]NIU05649.1 ABC transporter ATP-binding protein [Gammaproteobacteria bacterium]NIV52788.1 polyamine ABC transporter ATP-binding protein [Gammaproteobacteria bacterium]